MGDELNSERATVTTTLFVRPWIEKSKYLLISYFGRFSVAAAFFRWEDIGHGAQGACYRLQARLTAFPSVVQGRNQDGLGEGWRLLRIQLCCGSRLTGSGENMWREKVRSSRKQAHSSRARLKCLQPKRRPTGAPHAACVVSPYLPTRCYRLLLLRLLFHFHFYTHSIYFYFVVGTLT